MALISSSFPGNDEKPAARARTRERATKNPARHAARAPGVVSVNTLFSKILVTRVKRKIELPLSPSISPDFSPREFFGAGDRVCVLGQVVGQFDCGGP
jgi:hypothetical protein